MKERTLWIVDGSYLYQASRAIGCDLDYLKLKRLLEEETGTPDGFCESHYFNAIGDTQSGQARAFHNWLQSAPPVGPKIIPHLYGLKDQKAICPCCGYTFARTVQKAVDVGIATAIIKLSGKYDRLVLCAGDGDLKDAVEYVHSLGKKVFIAGFYQSVSCDLQGYAEKVIWLETYNDQLNQDRQSFGC